MIVTESVIIKVSNKNVKVFRNKGYICNSNDIIEVKTSDLSRSSRVIITAKCYYCNNNRDIKYCKYLDSILTGYFACSAKCAKAKAIVTNLEKYGVEHHMKNVDVKTKTKITNLERYGVDNPSKSDFIKDKIKKVFLDKYGVKCSLLNSDINKKSIQTNLIRYGVDNFSKSNDFYTNTIIGNDIDFVKYLSDSICLFKCNTGHYFDISTINYHSRINNSLPLCTICNPIGDSKSIKEKELFEFIESIYDDKIIQSYRDGLEIDIYLPELKLGFEFNGLYWHSEKFKNRTYHIDKTNFFKSKGIRIIHIWEDDWIFRNDITKSQICNLLKVNNEKIFARKCYIKEILDSRIATKFLNDNHIQGKVNSVLKLGLYYQDELVSIMTFDSFEGRKKMGESEYNLSRFCNKLGNNIIGGASKLLTYFIKNYDVKRIVSYADKDWSIGNLYYTLGFENVGENGPDYKYIVDKKRVHKSRYKKSKLNTSLTESQEMIKRDILKVYDCGKIKFERII